VAGTESSLLKKRNCLSVLFHIEKCQNPCIKTEIQNM